MGAVKEAVGRIIPEEGAIWGDEGALRFLRRVVAEPTGHIKDPTKLKKANAAKEAAQQALDDYKASILCPSYFFLQSLTLFYSPSEISF